MKYKIPIFKLNFPLLYRFNFLKKANEILTADRPIGESKYVKEFENKFAKLSNVKHAVACSNGTAALDLALRAIDVTNKEVIIPSNTFFATSVAVTNAGGKIKLVDIESENFSIDPKELKKKITQKTGAVIIVHIGGIISKHIEEIVSICKKHNIPLIEDAAHAQCSTYKGITAGSWGDLGCFSFFPTKVMTTGEGGMVTTNNDVLADKIKSLKNFGRDNNNAGVCINPLGNNYKINEFTGLLGSLECDRVISRINKRNKLVQRYIDNLKNSSYIPVLQEEGYCSYYKMILKTDIDREWLRSYCKNQGITLTGEVYNTPIHNQPLYSRYKNDKLPITDQVCLGHICPPLYPELTEKEVDYICQVLLQAENEK
jgi:dTDP-4-amino-4,6-dideoxygalactose transaminase